MSEVRRWKLKGFIPGIEGEFKAVFQPTVVLAEECDAALAREAALREELVTSRAAFKEELDGVKYTRRKFRQERDALQQRLTDAEKHAKLLEALMLESNELLYVIQEGLGPNLGAEVETMRGKVFAALKSVEGERS